MKNVIKKLKSKSGETLVEILIAILIIALSAGLFASMYTASANINRSAREKDEKIYDAVGQLEDFIGSANGGTKGKVKYTPTDSEGNSQSDGEKDVEVQVFTQDGMTAYTGGT